LGKGTTHFKVSRSSFNGKDSFTPIIFDEPTAASNFVDANILLVPLTEVVVSVTTDLKLTDIISLSVFFCIAMVELSLLLYANCSCGKVMAQSPMRESDHLLAKSEEFPLINH
jgi:hypothetical protein